MWAVQALISYWALSLSYKHGLDWELGSSHTLVMPFCLRVFHGLERVNVI